jgi:hypothetical protein
MFSKVCAVLWNLETCKHRSKQCMLGRTEESRTSSCESIHSGTHHPVHSYPEHSFLVLLSAVEL